MVHPTSATRGYCKNCSIMSKRDCLLVNLNFKSYFNPSVYVIVFIFGLLANGWALKFMWTRWRKMGNINIFALNLCVADILYLLTLPFLTTYYAHMEHTWIFGQPFCKLTRFLFYINLYGSIGFITCISVYRYLGIVHALKVKGRITARRSIAIATLVWILVFLQCLPDVFFDKAPKGKLKCYDTTVDNSTEIYMKYSVGKTVTGFVIPFLIIMCCYGHMAVMLARKKDVTDAMLRRKCLRLVVILALLFSLCFIPFHIFRNLNLATRIAKRRGICKAWFPKVYLARQISEVLVCLHNILNPLVYLLLGDELLKKWFKCGQTERSNTESQALR